jgi:hypothetical protein
MGRESGKISGLPETGIMFLYVPRSGILHQCRKLPENAPHA